MGLDRRWSDRDVLVERGSATVEGIAAIALVFLLLTVLTQAATALIVHRSVQAAVVVSAARLAIDPGSESAERVRLASEVASIVPGTGPVIVEADVGSRFVTSSARFEFVPPGPMFDTIWMEVRSDAPIVLDP